MHHSKDRDEQIAEQFREMELGPTGRFPEGHLTDNDEGEIRIGITSLKGCIVISFGEPIASIGFTPQQARQVANTLRQHANRIEPKRGSKRRR